MTHEELLFKISHMWDDDFDHVEFCRYNALRAVVELHYPWEITWAATENFIACYSCAEIYPCPTIETIMEEIK